MALLSPVPWGPPAGSCHPSQVWVSPNSLPRFPPLPISVDCSASEKSLQEQHADSSRIFSLMSEPFLKLQKCTQGREGPEGGTQCLLAGPMCFGEEFQVEGLQVRLDHNPQAVNGRDLRFSLRLQAQQRSLGITGRDTCLGLWLQRLPQSHPRERREAVASTRYTTWTMEQSWLNYLDLHILQWFLGLGGSETSLSSFRHVSKACDQGAERTSSMTTVGGRMSFLLFLEGLPCARHVLTTL